LELRSHTAQTIKGLTSAGHNEETLEKIIAALRTEANAYRMNGRIRGGLGSITFTDRGRTINHAPGISWRQGDGRALFIVPEPESASVDSPNATMLINAFRRAYGEDTQRISEVLLAFMDHESEFAAVGYLLVLVGHKLGILEEAFEAAWARLRGDDHMPFSEVLSLTSCLIRYDYSSIPVPVLSKLEARTIELGDGEAFRIPLLVSQARVAMERASDETCSSTDD
jgi:hypothetical protein